MINTQIYIDNIKNTMENLTWTSPSSAGTTSFNAVYDFPNWIHDQGFPFLVILDSPQGSSEATNIDNEMETIIQFHICANWRDVTGTGDAGKRDEAMLRIREAYDAVREYVLSDANIQSWLTSPTNAVRGSASNLTWRKNDIQVEDSNIEEFNLFRRIISLPISDIVNND